MRPSAPQSINELLRRVDDIAGLTIGDLASKYQFKTPKDLLREKGWIGQLIEWVLGAMAGSKPEPDFIDLGIELKTLPISYSGKPIETTFVSTPPSFNNSWVERAKSTSDPEAMIVTLLS